MTTRKEQILNYFLSKKPDYSFKWQKTQNWVAVYETVESLFQKTKIPKSSIRKVINELSKEIEGFSYDSGLIHYEWKIN